MSIATITSRGRITLPQAVRDALNVQCGSKVVFVPQADGSFRLVALRSDVGSLKGVFAGRTVRPISILAMSEAIEAEAGKGLCT